MKNIKKGFSLAEVLIAIAIVGVIAAINIPTVVSETQNRKMAAALGRNVEAIETGCQLILQQASEISERRGDGVVNGIWEVRINDIDSSAQSDRLLNNNNGNLFSDITSNFFNTVLRTLNNYNVSGINGGTASPPRNQLASNYAISSKFGSIYGYSYNHEANFDNLNDPIVAFIYIDVNAASAPNRYGRDIFLFGLTDSCHMVPAGTPRIRAMNNSIPLENTSAGCVGDNPSNGLSCTSRVVRNGYRIDY